MCKADKHKYGATLRESSVDNHVIWYGSGVFSLALGFILEDGSTPTQSVYVCMEPSSRIKPKAGTENTTPIPDYNSCTQPTKLYVHHLLSSQSSWSTCMSFSRNLPLSRPANNTYQNTIKVSLHSLLLPPVQHYLTIPNRFSAIVHTCNKQTHNHIHVQRKGRVICLNLLRPPAVDASVLDIVADVCSMCTTLTVDCTKLPSKPI